MTEDGIPTIYKAALVALSIFSSNDLFGILLILKNLGWAFQASFEKFYPKKKKKNKMNFGNKKKKVYRIYIITPALKTSTSIPY